MSSSKLFPSLFALAGVLAVALTLVMWTTNRGVSNVQAADVGVAAPAFELPDTAGDTVSLESLAGKTVVLHWQSMNCPWDVAYQPILNDMATEYADNDVVFIAINSNFNETDMEALASYAESSGMTYPILKDAGNVIADAYGAQTTPHMFVVDGEGELVYAGGLESRPRNPGAVGGSDEQYLTAVLDAIVAGEELPYTETGSTGCSVKRAR